MNPLEISAALLGAVYVILAVKGNVWCWLAGIMSAALYIVFDWQLKYFQDGILQIFYVLAGFYGWYWWTMGKSNSGNVIIISPAKRKQLVLLTVSGILLFPVTGFIFSKFGNAFSYGDAFTTVFSFVATYLTAKKIIESWLMWILIDLVLIIQYMLKDAYVTSGLYLFLTIMAVVGYYEWKKQIITA